MIKHVDEIKLHINEWIYNSINTMFVPDSIPNKLLNATAKALYEQKKGIIYKAIDIFKDENNNIDTDLIIQQYEDVLFPNGRLDFNLSDITSYFNVNLPTFIGDKHITLYKSDLYSLLGIPNK